LQVYPAAVLQYQSTTWIQDGAEALILEHVQIHHTVEILSDLPWIMME
jgi:hypothetical protein